MNFAGQLPSKMCIYVYTAIFVDGYYEEEIEDLEIMT